MAEELVERFDVPEVDDLRGYLEDQLENEESVVCPETEYFAEEKLCHHGSLLKEAMREFFQTCYNPLDKGAVWCDNIIRLYVLPEAIEKAIRIIAPEFDAQRG